MKKIILMAGLLASASSQADVLNDSLNYMTDVLASDYQYVSAYITTSDYNAPVISDNAAGFSVLVGHHLKAIPLTLEAGFSNLGESTITPKQGDDYDISSKTFFADAKYSVQLLNKVHGYAKVGLNRITVKQSNLSSSLTRTKTEMMYVAGAQYNVNNVASIHSEFVAYSADITSLSLGLAFKF